MCDWAHVQQQVLQASACCCAVGLCSSCVLAQPLVDVGHVYKCRWQETGVVTWQELVSEKPAWFATTANSAESGAHFAPQCGCTDACTVRHAVGARLSARSQIGYTCRPTLTCKVHCSINAAGCYPRNDLQEHRCTQQTNTQTHGQALECHTTFGGALVVPFLCSATATDGLLKHGCSKV